MTRLFPNIAWNDWLFSAKTFLASMLALYIALAVGLDRPYWAMAAVYVVANPLSGATRSKALYRALGTVLGAAGSVFLLPVFANSPELFCLVMSLWTGGFLFLSLLDRSPRSYVFMLAGYSLPLIALPAVSDPTTIFDVALARTEEIVLGIMCASLVHSLILPGRIGPVLGAQATAWMRDAAAWAGDNLRDENNAGATREHQRLATDIRALDMLISQLAYDSATRSTTQLARQLRGRMALLLPLLSSLADRLDAVRATGEEPQAFGVLKGDILAWIKAGIGADETIADHLITEIEALEPKGEHCAEWNNLVLSSALERMRELVDLWQDCRTLGKQILLGDRAGRFRPMFRQRRVVGPSRHYDFGLIAFSAGSVVMATLLSCALWLATGWSEGAGCVTMTAVGCSFFAALDNPAAQIKTFSLFMVASVVASGFYLFAILPLVHEFETLVAVFAIPFLVFGRLVTRPQFTMMAMLMTINTATFVALQSTYSADFSTFLNTNLASIAGGVFGFYWTVLTRPFGAAFAARRLVEAGWADIAATARGGRNENQENFAGRVFDRLGQLVPRLAQGVDHDVAAADLLAELRVGINILDLQRVRSGLQSQLRVPLDTVLNGVAGHYAEQVASGSANEPGKPLLSAIDNALGTFAQTSDFAAMRPVLQALVGLRRAFFPAMAAPTRELTDPSLAIAAQ